MTARRVFCNLCVFSISALVLLLPSAANALAPPSTPQSQSAVHGFGKLPLSFEANQGQTDAQVKFLARGRGYTLFLLPTEAALALTNPAGSDAKPSQTVLRMKLLDANSSAEIVGLKELPGKTHYFLGNDPKQWRTNVPTYQEVRQKDVYPGIDLIYYGKERRLEYDFVVAPGADPGVITLGFEGQQDIQIDAGGDLILETGAGQVRLHKPFVYQEQDGTKELIASRYNLRGPDQIGVEIAAYDSALPLIIDPVLSYSTYLGGSGSDSSGINALKVDTAGSAYLAGTTSSVNFPTTAGSFRSAPIGGSDAFVAKLNPAGNGLVYATYLGGTNIENARSLTLDAAGNVYVIGDTNSTNFPTTPGAFQITLAGGFDGYVTKLDANGAALMYSTYLGGTQNDENWGIAVDGVGNAHMTGHAQAGFPTTSGAFSTTFPSGDAEIFVTKLNATGTGLLYSTAVPGAHPATDTGRHIVIDPAGNAYVVGQTRTGIGTPGAFQTGYQGGDSDGFVLKLNPSGSALVYATNLGGSGPDQANSIEIDVFGNAYVCGSTSSNNFPTTSGAFQTVFGGGVNDGFLAKLAPTGASLVFSTFLGGNSEETGCVLAIDGPTGNIHTLSGTRSTNLSTTTGAFQTALSGGFDSYVATVKPDGSGVLFASYLGGTGNENTGGFGVALDTFGNVYLTADTASTNFPTTAGSFQPTFGGSSDAYVVKIQFNVPVDIDIKPGSFPNSINLGSQGTVPVAILGSASFDASQVDPLTVSLAGASVKLKGKGTPMASLEDVNFDGFLDMVVHVSTEALQLSSTDTQAVVEGQTIGGASFRGLDSVRIVPAD